jgi:hypothetical protein
MAMGGRPGGLAEAEDGTPDPLDCIGCVDGGLLLLPPPPPSMDPPTVSGDDRGDAPFGSWPDADDTGICDSRCGGIMPGPIGKPYG